MPASWATTNRCRAALARCSSSCFRVGAEGSPHTRRHHKYVTVPTGCRQLPGTPPPPPLLHAATASQPPSNRRVSCLAPPHWGRGREVCSPSHSRRCRGSPPLSRQQAAGSELAAGDLLLQLVHILHKLLAAALWGVERGVCVGGGGSV